MDASTASLLQEGLTLHRRGALGEASSRYSEVLRNDPVNADALYYLAMIACQQGQFDGGVEFARRALATSPRQARVHNLLGMALARLGQGAAALRSFDAAIDCQPDFAEAHGNRANTLAEVGRLSEAVASYDRAVAVRPDSFEDWCNRGVVLFQLGRHAEAIASYDRALASKPDFIEAHVQRGIVLAQIGRCEEALSSYDNALRLDPSHADALNNRGNTLRTLDRRDEALASLDRAIAVVPGHVAALCNRAALLSELGRYDDALASFDMALAVTPDHIGALNNRGIALSRLEHHEQALASFQRVLAMAPDNVDALNNRGNALSSLLRNEEALASYEQALLKAPEHVDALSNRANVLVELGRHAEALAAYDRALAIRPRHADTVYRRGNALRRLQRFNEAIDCYQRTLELDPGHADAFNALVSCRLLICDWREMAALSGEIRTRVSAGTSAVEPFISLVIDCTAAEQLECARNFLRLKGLAPAAAPTVRRSAQAGKLRIAYLSADFRRHPVAYLIAGLFGLHDRTRFDVFGIALGNDDRSEIRARIARSFDQFHDVRGRSDRQVVGLLRDLEVDIAIDLTGHTEDSRLGILAARPAPVQVTYLGYPGTTGAEFIDYVIADPFVLPFEQQPVYTERIVHLPDCYQVNDSTKAVAPGTPSRREAGLPDTGVVFCCFNQNYKIMPPVFDVWVRLLRRVEGSVLWLLGGNDAAAANLREAAAARGVDPARLVFAPRLDLAEHLARFRLADLFLDTLPYNAHTTASDALWVGVPVVTCTGATFAGRVAASLLNAIGVPELATDNLADYEALALALALDPSRRRAVRRQIEQHRATHPLFDTDRTRRHLEAAYATMWDIYRRGERPRGFRVDPLGC